MFLFFVSRKSFNIGIVNLGFFWKRFLSFNIIDMLEWERKGVDFK